ncbi:hypothetical protein L7F22_008483 [Adiantum nelumboides]|nr:hypothetical protein [Adiantum nelumboides]
MASKDCESEKKQGGQKHKKRQGTLLQWAGVAASKINSKKTKDEVSYDKGNGSNLVVDETLSLSEKLELHRRIEARATFQDSWLEKFDWLVYDKDKVRLFCKFCMKYPHHHSAYSKEGSINFKVSNFKAHCRTECHVNAMEAFLMEGKESIQNSMKKVENFKDEALMTLFKVAYHMAKKRYAFSGFPDMIGLLQDCRVPFTTSLYNDDKACVEMVYCIGKCLMDATLKKVCRSPFFGVLIDESNDISKHGHLIIYLSYLIDDCVPSYSFYGIVRINDGTARAIYHAVIEELKNSKLDLSRLIAFGSDGCSTMTGKDNGVATLFRRYINPFLSSIHCVAHRAALAVSNVAKKMDYSKALEKLVNSIASYFNASGKRLEELRILQEDLACPNLKLEHTFDVRWLMHGIIQKEIKLIRQYYIDSPEVDCNALTFDVDGYAFLPEHGPDKGHLFTLRGALRGKKFFDIEIDRDIFGADLTSALDFQISFATEIIANLEARFADNSILSKLRILVPAQHPVLEKALRDYGKSEAQEIASFYGKEKALELINFPSLIDENDFLSEFRSFKTQAAIDWVRFSLPDVASAIACNATWRDSYPNILTVCQIALVQCSSNAICERGFSTRTLIKTKLRNSMEIRSLDALMKIAIEGPFKLCDAELEESIVLWGAKAHRHLYTDDHNRNILQGNKIYKDKNSSDEEKTETKEDEDTQRDFQEKVPLEFEEDDEEDNSIPLDRKGREKARESNVPRTNTQIAYTEAPKRVEERKMKLADIRAAKKIASTNTIPQTMEQARQYRLEKAKELQAKRKRIEEEQRAKEVDLTSQSPKEPREKETVDITGHLEHLKKIQRERHLEKKRAAALAREKIKESLKRTAEEVVLEPREGGLKKQQKEREEDIEHIQMDPTPPSPIAQPPQPSPSSP